MARPILTDAERLDWERFPADPGPDVVGAYFTLADGEVDVLRRLPTPAGRLATAVAVAAIRWLGFVPADLGRRPRPACSGSRASSTPTRTSSGPMSRPSARRASIASALRGSLASATRTSEIWRGLRSYSSSPRSSTTRRSRCCGPRRCGCVSAAAAPCALDA
jgi:hypothetical protein